MSLFDIVILGVLIWQIYSGFHKGLITSLVSTFGWILALMGARAWAKDIMPLFDGVSQEPLLQFVCGFIAIFVLALVALAGCEYILKIIIKKASLGIVDKTAGALVGLVKSILIMLILVSLVGPLFKNSTLLADSKFVVAFEQVSPKLIESFKTYITDFFTEMQQLDLEKKQAEQPEKAS